jgi:hypothetical protein
MTDAGNSVTKAKLAPERCSDDYGTIAETRITGGGPSRRFA